MPVNAPADKRFKRAHVSPARKRRILNAPAGMAIKAGVVVALVLIGLYQAASLVLTAEALVIDRITVSGNDRMSRGEVVSLLDGVRGQNMLTVDLEEWRNKLKSSPWVADVAIRRVLPDTVAVVVLEREPIGIGRIADGLYLVDRDGAIIDTFGPNYAELDLPIIDGLAAGGGALLVDENRAALAARVLDALAPRPDLSARISQIDVADVRDAVLILEGDTVALRVGNEQFLERLQSYFDLAPALRERVQNIDYVDLRFDERVYVRPTSGAGGKAGRH
jgi:cell division protein FtsQ